MIIVGIILFVVVMTFAEAGAFMLLLGIMAHTFGIPFLAIGYWNTFVLWLGYALLRSVTMFSKGIVEGVTDEIS